MNDTVKIKVMEGVKHDGEKPRLDLIQPEVINALGMALSYGAKKYGDNNYLHGMSWGRVFGACLRHLYAFWAGEDIDKESGLPHLAHALANISFLTVYQARGLGTDTRYKAPQDIQKK
jgi:hypothetical protein